MPDGTQPTLPAVRFARPGAALLLGWRNLAHDRARFIVTMVGIIFAVVLVAVQAGLFLGFTVTTTAVIEHSRADLWIAAKGLRNFEITTPQRERIRNLVQGMPGVARAEAVMVFFSAWHKPQGGAESILVIGFDPQGELVGPWDMAQGDPADLRLPDSVIIDDITAAKLGVSAPGDQAEIAGHRARVVGFTHGIRSFTTSPYVFAPLRTAVKYGPLDEDQINYVVAGLLPGADAAAVKAEIQRRLPDYDVLTRDEFSRMTENYWMYTTGAGSALLMAAGLGLVVGMVIVAQVLYATTVDHLTEFGTLRAMGAPQGFILRIILWQATISATFGHAVGITIALLLARASRNGTALIEVPPPLAAGLFLVTFAMCSLAALVSIRKAMTIDPAMVFQK